MCKSVQFWHGLRHLLARAPRSEVRSGATGKHLPLLRLSASDPERLKRLLSGTPKLGEKSTWVKAHQSVPPRSGGPPNKTS